MKINLLAFGIVKDVFNGPSTEIELPAEATVADLKTLLGNQYPTLKQSVSYMIAVNNEYASPNDSIRQGDEVAIIPPVSGG